MALIDLLPPEEAKAMLAQVDRTLAQAEARLAQAEMVMDSIKQLVDNVNLIVLRFQDLTATKGKSR